MYQLESNIPLPPIAPRKPNGPRKYPAREMAIGQSFFVPNMPDGMRGSVIRHAREQYNITLETRQMDGGVRFWRVK